MKWFLGPYAQRFNQRHERDGHLFRGRFYSKRIKTPAHLISAITYVVLNPVRAGIVERPEQWLWSSYSATIGRRRAPMFVPFACGAVLIREGGRVLRDAFDISPEYLSEDRGGADVEYDFFRYGQMGTRRFNSLKLWMAWKFLGRSGYAQLLEKQIALTEYLAEPDRRVARF